MACPFEAIHRRGAILSRPALPTPWRLSAKPGSPHALNTPHGNQTGTRSTLAFADAFLGFGARSAVDLNYGGVIEAFKASRERLALSLLRKATCSCRNEYGPPPQPVRN